MPSPGYSGFYRLTGAKQTMVSWASLIDTFEAVPEIYKDAYRALAGDADIPHTVLAPGQGRAAEKLLCDTGDTFYILERARARIAATGFRYADICSLEVGNILLFSWFSISGKTTTGSDAEVTVEFNEATLRHFKPFFQKMRPAPTTPAGYDYEQERAKFASTLMVDYKFWNFARESLVQGERVEWFVYQPENRRRLFSVLGRGVYQTVSMAHLVILTDHELILIANTTRITEKRQSNYGGVWRYFPLHAVSSAALHETPEGLQELTIYGASGACARLQFDASHRAQVEELARLLSTGALAGVP